MAYLRNRLIQAFVTLYSVVTLSFLLHKLMPGGPIDYLRSQLRRNPRRYGLSDPPADNAIRDYIAQRVSIPPDKPLHEAYIHYMEQVFVHFDLGESILVAPGVDVTQLYLQAAPWTVFLSAIGLIYGVVVGIVFGALMAYYEGTKFDIGLTITMIVDNSIPYYIAAIFLLLIFGFQLGWFPTGGRVNHRATPGINWPFISSIFYHAALPALSFIVTGFGGRALGLRANAIRLLGSDNIRVARLRGLSRYRIATTYLARNAILPMYTSIVIGLSGLLGGTVILEQIFQYPGMGLLVFTSAVGRDFPVLMGGVILTSALFIAGTILADLTYSLIDPRVDITASRK